MTGIFTKPLENAFSDEMAPKDRRECGKEEFAFLNLLNKWPEVSFILRDLESVCQP